MVLSHCVHCAHEREAGQTFTASCCKAVFLPYFFLFSEHDYNLCYNTDRQALGYSCKTSASGEVSWDYMCLYLLQPVRIEGMRPLYSTMLAEFILLSPAQV